MNPTIDIAFIDTIEIIYQIKIDQKHEFKVLLILKEHLKTTKLHTQ